MHEGSEVGGKVVGMRWETTLPPLQLLILLYLPLRLLLLLLLPLPPIELPPPLLLPTPSLRLVPSPVVAVPLLLQLGGESHGGEKAPKAPAGLTRTVEVNIAAIRVVSEGTKSQSVESPFRVEAS